jgi:hypothetical protein
MILLTSIREPICIGVNEKALTDVSSVVPGLTVWSLLAQLLPGDSTPSLFPVPGERGTGVAPWPNIAGMFLGKLLAHAMPLRTGYLEQQID